MFVIASIEAPIGCVPSVSLKSDNGSPFGVCIVYLHSVICTVLFALCDYDAISWKSSMGGGSSS